MAPRKRLLREVDGDSGGVQSPPATTRVTRSSSARKAAPAPEPLPPPQKKKTPAKGKPKPKPEDEALPEVTGGLTESPEDDAVPEVTVGLPESPESGTGEVEEPEPLPSAEKKGRTVVIEHCKQCNSFKTRALQVKAGLESCVSGITVLVNPEKPRRGCFEVREEGGEKFVSLLEMKRPFGPMKALDMEKVILEITDKLNGVK